MVISGAVPFLKSMKPNSWFILRQGKKIPPAQIFMLQAWTVKNCKDSVLAIIHTVLTYRPVDPIL